MLNGIALSAMTRNALLAVQETNSNIGKTQNRLESGKAVNSAIDDAVKYFQSKGLSDRAADFMTLKNSMDQRISLIKAGNGGLTTAARIYKQMAGLVQAAKTADGAAAIGLSSQWKDLVGQLNSLGNEAKYQNESVIVPDPNPYPANFDAKTYFSYPKEVGRQPVKVQTNLDGSGLNVAIGALPTYDLVRNNLPPNPDIRDAGNGHYYMYVATPRSPIDARTDAESMVYNGMQGYLANITSQAENDFIHNNFTNQRAWVGGTDELHEGVWRWESGSEAGQNIPTWTQPGVAGYENWAPYTYKSGKVGNEPNNGDGAGAENYLLLNWTGSGQWNDWGRPGDQAGYIVEFSSDFPAPMQGSGDPTLVSVANYLESPVNIQRAENWCNKASHYVNALQAAIGGHITTLQNRMSFCEQIANTSLEGADKLQLADLNKEGANLVALEARSQIGIQAISMSGEAQRSIISLLR